MQGNARNAQLETRDAEPTSTVYTGIQYAVAATLTRHASRTPTPPFHQAAGGASGESGQSVGDGSVASEVR